MVLIRNIETIMAAIVNRNQLTCPNCRKLCLTTAARDKHLRGCRDDNKIKTSWIHIYSNSEPVNANSSPFDGFYQRISKKKKSWALGSESFTISRNQILQDSIEVLQGLSEESWFKEFNVSFMGEIGDDAGGLTKEWLDLLMREFFSSALFEKTSTDEDFFTIPSLCSTSNFASYYIFGKLISKILLEKQTVYCRLHNVIFKQLLGIEVVPEDFKDFNRAMYDSFKQCEEIDINELDFKFCVNIKGRSEPVELKENGAQTSVNNENKLEYLHLYAMFEMVTGVKDAVNCLRKGFFSVIDEEMMKGVSAEELFRMINGNEVINVEELQNFTEYKGEFHSNHPVVLMFWRIVKGWDQERVKKFLQFVTGCSCAPLRGFAELQTTRGERCRFNIVPIPEDKGFPRAHTCFNRLELQVNSDEELMASRLNFVTSRTFEYNLS